MAVGAGSAAARGRTPAPEPTSLGRRGDLREALRLLLQTAQLEADPSIRGYEERVARQLSEHPETVTEEYVRQLRAGLARLEKPCRRR